MNMGLIGWPETSVRNYDRSLRNNPEERSSRNNQYNAQICTNALFYMLAPTCFGSSLPSSGSFWIRRSYVKIQIDMEVYFATAIWNHVYIRHHILWSPYVCKHKLAWVAEFSEGVGNVIVSFVCGCECGCIGWTLQVWKCKRGYTG
jgi:hypothetical protein